MQTTGRPKWRGRSFIWGRAEASRDGKPPKGFGLSTEEEKKKRERGGKRVKNSLRKKGGR